MQSEHKFIAGILLVLLILIFVAFGIYIVRKMLTTAPLDKFMRFPLIMTAISLLVGIGFYHLHKFMHDGHSGIQDEMTSILPLYAGFMVGWISSYITRRRDSET